MTPLQKELIAKLRYMGKQYSGGQAARGGGLHKHYLEEAADELERLASPCSDALHASAPPGCGCADCAMDKEPCPRCYGAWWEKRHPNVMQVGAARSAEGDVKDARFQWLLHNLGTVHTWAARVWRPKYDGPLIPWLESRIDAALYPLPAKEEKWQR